MGIVDCLGVLAAFPLSSSPKLIGFGNGFGSFGSVFCVPVTDELTRQFLNQSGNKFAVTSGMKCVPICNFDPSSNWWVSKIIKKHKSTVLSVAWCPNNKVRTFKCFENSWLSRFW
jgi:hypothetical protein